MHSLDISGSQTGDDDVDLGGRKQKGEVTSLGLSRLTPRVLPTFVPRTGDIGHWFSSSLKNSLKM